MSSVASIIQAVASSQRMAHQNVREEEESRRREEELRRAGEKHPIELQSMRQTTAQEQAEMKKRVFDLRKAEDDLRRAQETHDIDIGLQLLNTARDVRAAGRKANVPGQVVGGLTTTATGKPYEARLPNGASVRFDPTTGGIASVDPTGAVSSPARFSELASVLKSPGDNREKFRALMNYYSPEATKGAEQKVGAVPMAVLQADALQMATGYKEFDPDVAVWSTIETMVPEEAIAGVRARIDRMKQEGGGVEPYAALGSDIAASLDKAITARATSSGTLSEAVLGGLQTVAKTLNSGKLSENNAVALQVGMDLWMQEQRLKGEEATQIIDGQRRSRLSYGTQMLLDPVKAAVTEMVSSPDAAVAVIRDTLGAGGMDLPGTLGAGAWLEFVAEGNAGRGASSQHLAKAIVSKMILELPADPITKKDLLDAVGSYGTAGAEPNPLHVVVKSFEQGFHTAVQAAQTRYQAVGGALSESKVYQDEMNNFSKQYQGFVSQTEDGRQTKAKQVPRSEVVHAYIANIAASIEPTLAAPTIDARKKPARDATVEPMSGENLGPPSASMGTGKTPTGRGLRSALNLSMREMESRGQGGTVVPLLSSRGGAAAIWVGDAYTMALARAADVCEMVGDSGRWKVLPVGDQMVRVPEVPDFMTYLVNHAANATTRITDTRQAQKGTVPAENAWTVLGRVMDATKGGRGVTTVFAVPGKGSYDVTKPGELAKLQQYAMYEAAKNGDMMLAAAWAHMDGKGMDVAQSGVVAGLYEEQITGVKAEADALTTALTQWASPGKVPVPKSKELPLSTPTTKSPASYQYVATPVTERRRTTAETEVDVKQDHAQQLEDLYRHLIF